MAGATCNVCQRNTYVVTLGGGGGYNYGAANGNQCGSVQTGTCNAALTCTNLGPFGAACFATPAPPTAQPN